MVIGPVEIQKLLIRQIRDILWITAGLHAITGVRE